MKTSRIIWIVIGVVVVIILFSGCRQYNRLVQLNQDVPKQWAQVENVYQRRADLIPNLVNTVKGYAAHEQATLTQVVEARSKATSVKIDASNMTDADLQRFQAAQGQVGSALSRLLAVVEADPDLKANQNFLELQTELSRTENRIANERRVFNDVTADYNKAIKSFPTLLYAGALGFKEKPYFQAEAGANEAPEVKF